MTAEETRIVQLEEKVEDLEGALVETTRMVLALAQGYLDPRTVWDVYRRGWVRKNEGNTIGIYADPGQSAEQIVWSHAERSRGERLRKRAGEAVAAADLSAPSVLRALQEAVAAKSTGKVKARDVAVALMPNLRNPDEPGRQELIVRVGYVMRSELEPENAVRVGPNHDWWTTTQACDGGRDD